MSRRHLDQPWPASTDARQKPVILIPESGKLAADTGRAGQARP